MDNLLFKLVGKNVPTINPKIANGLAVSEFKYVEQYVDNIIRGSKELFIEGLTYVGYKKLTPLEEFLKVTEPKGSSRAYYNVAKSDFYMILLEFNYKGESITKPMYLPYCRDGNIISIRGATLTISPVLADKGISITSDSVFIQIPQFKKTFKAAKHHYMAYGDGTKGIEKRSPNIVYSWLHNRDRKANVGAGKPLIVMNTCLPHYLFCKYGVIETFKQFCNTDIVIGGAEITRERYPAKDWVICESTRIKPKGFKTKVYQPTTLRVAIRSCDFDTISDSMIGSFFYVVDHFPQRILPEFLNGTRHEARLWRILLGTIIGGITGGEGAIMKGMDEHMNSLDNYIDPAAKDFLRQGDIFVDNVYQLLYYVVEILSGMVMQPIEVNADMYNKQFLVLRYVLQDINDGIFRALFRLKNEASKKELTPIMVRTLLTRRLMVDAVANMSKHGEVNPVSSPGDNKFFKITSNVVLQTDSGNGARRSKGKAKGVDNSKYLHASIAEVGSYIVLPKSEPTGRTRINPFLQLNNDGSIAPDPKHCKVLTKAQKQFRRE